MLRKYEDVAKEGKELFDRMYRGGCRNEKERNDFARGYALGHINGKSEAIKEIKEDLKRGNVGLSDTR